MKDRVPHIFFIRNNRIEAYYFYILFDKIKSIIIFFQWDKNEISGFNVLIARKNDILEVEEKLHTNSENYVKLESFLLTLSGKFHDVFICNV